MLRVVLKKNIKMWEECLPHVEFAYNRSLHSTTKMYPFQIVYGLLPRALIDLMHLPSSEKLNFDAKQCAELMLKMHETSKENIDRMNSKYKISGDKGRKQLAFEPGDLVWLHLRKERFPDLRKSKLMHRADGVPSRFLWDLNRAHPSLKNSVSMFCFPNAPECTMETQITPDTKTQVRSNVWDSH
jgi:hypothetical protein